VVQRVRQIEGLEAKIAGSIAIDPPTKLQYNCASDIPIRTVHPRFSANFGSLPGLSFITFGRRPFNSSYFEAASKRVYSSICRDQNACSIHGGSHSWTHLKPCACFWLYARSTTTGGQDCIRIGGLDWS
jgi:hypothetical protein